LIPPETLNPAGVPPGIVCVTANRVLAAMAALPLKLQLDVPDATVQVAAVAV